MKVIAKPTQGIVVTMCGKNHFAHHGLDGYALSNSEDRKPEEVVLKKAS